MGKCVLQIISLSQVPEDRTSSPLLQNLRSSSQCSSSALQHGCSQFICQCDPRALTYSLELRLDVISEISSPTSACSRVSCEVRPGCRALSTCVLKTSEDRNYIYAQDIGQEIICFLREEKTMQLAIWIRPKKVIRKCTYLKTFNVGVVKMHQRPLNQRSREDMKTMCWFFSQAQELILQ